MKALRGDIAKPHRWIVWCVTSISIVLLSFSFSAPATAAGDTWRVGPTRSLTTPSQAAAVAQDGDTVLIDAGTYTGDVAVWPQNNLTIKGNGGLAHLEADGNSAQDKGIWVIQGNDVTVDSMEFSGASVSDANGAGIRFEGTNLTVTNSSFHDDENGILEGMVNPDSDIVIKDSLFYHCGAGDGQSHNFYIGQVRSLTVTGSYMWGANVGNEMKSRAATNTIIGNLIDDADSQASWSVDLPNGGQSLIAGNVIIQGPNSQNSNLVNYGQEGFATGYSHELWVVNNTFVNKMDHGTFLMLQPGSNANVVNNLFVGDGTLANQTLTSEDGNLDVDNTSFVSPATNDYHLVSSSSAIDQGVAVPTQWKATLEYVAPQQSAPRPVSGVVDVGAYEYTSSLPPGLVDVTSASITGVTVPVTGQPLGTTASLSSGETGYSISHVAWAPSDSTAKPGTVYTASVTIAAASGYSLNNLSSATINGHAATVANATTAQATVSYAFATTGAPGGDDFTSVTPIVAPTTPDEQFFNMRLQYFLPETEPLIKQTFGTTLTFDNSAFWQYPSYYSCAVSFATNLPTLTKADYGTDTGYGTSTPQTESYYYQHTLYLVGLQPGTTYHYQIKTKGSDGAFMTSGDKTCTTLALTSDVIRIPDDLSGQSAPYWLTKGGTATAPAKYVLTEDLTVPNGGIIIAASYVDLDLGGHTITYDNAPNTVVNEKNNSRSDFMYGVNGNTDFGTFGVRSGLWNFTHQNIFNGKIVQGANGGAGINGTGYNPIYSIQSSYMEIAGITVDYYGDNINGIDVSSHLNIHNNIVYDRGTGIDLRDLQIRAITAYDSSDQTNVTAYNSVRRCRQVGITTGGEQKGNEVYGDSYSTNSFLISYASNSTTEDNKIFGLGYMPIGIGGGNMTNAVARDNFIYVNAYAPEQRFAEYGRTSGATGFRPQIYATASGSPNTSVLFKDNLFEDNVVVAKAWPGSAYIRALWVGSDNGQAGMVVSDNTVKAETMTDEIDTTDGGYSFSCIEFQGWDQVTSPPVVKFTDNKLITNVTFIAFGSGYGIGNNGAFYNTTFEKIDHNSSYYQPIRMGYWYWNSINNKLIDSVAGPGVDLSKPPVNISYDTDNALALDIGVSSTRTYVAADTGHPLANTTVTWTTDGGDHGSFTTDSHGIADNEWITTHNSHDVGDPGQTMRQVQNTAVTFTVVGYDPVTKAIADLQGTGPDVVFGASAVFCTGVAGSLTSSDSLVPWSGNGGYDATHYNIDLTYNPGPPVTISAETTINATVTGQPLCSFSLDLLGLDVSSVVVDGHTASFSRIQDAATNTYKLVVTPATPVSSDFTVVVTYSGTPQQFTFHGSSNFAVGWLQDQAFSAGGTTYPADGGGVGLGEPVGAFAWYPVNATPSDKASYTTILTAPNTFQAVGIGKLVSTKAVGTSQTQWTWDEPDAVPSSFTIAAIGNYQAYTDMYTTSSGHTVPIDIRTDPNVTNGGSVPTHYMALTKQLLDWGEANFGPYCPAVAGYVMKPISVSYALEVYGKPFYTGDWGDSIYAHEFAHQWGGNCVTVADWSDLWLAEGFATYVQWLWDEDNNGSTVTDQALDLYNLPDTNSLWSVAPAGMTSQSQMFGSWNYEGGALALAALRVGIGSDLMDQVLQTWFAQYAGGNASTQDFIDVAESVSGVDLTQWAHDYLFTAGKPPSWPAALSYLPPPVQPQTLTFSQTSMTKTFGDAAFTNPLAHVGDGTVSFASINLAVATVDSTGQVTIVGAGTSSITATAASVKDQWLGASETYTLTVTPQTLPAGTVITVTGPTTYTGGPLTPPVTVTVSGNTLTRDTDYTVTYSDNTNAGVATITVTGIGNYAGTTTSQFTIGPRVVTFTLDPIADQTHTGTALTPPVTVRDGATLLPNQDFNVSYADNTDPGTATATITGTGNYAGSTGTVTFSIVMPTPTLSLAQSTWSVQAGADSTVISVTTNQTSWTVASDQTWLTATRTGSTITLSTDANPDAVSRTATVTVTAGTLTSTVIVTQAGTVITVTTPTWVLDSAGGTQQITVSSDSGLGWQAAGLPTWLTATALSGSDTTPLVLTAAPFTGNPWAVRTATIILTVVGSDPSHPTQAQIVVFQHNWSGPAIVTHDGMSVTQVQIGWTVTGVAAGFQPGESVHGTMLSLPLDLGPQTADDNGVVQFTWVIPKDTPIGDHTFVASGQTQTMFAYFTVPAAVPANQPSIPAGPNVPTTPQVAATGGAPLQGPDGWASLLLLVGAALHTALGLRRLVSHMSSNF